MKTVERLQKAYDNAYRIQFDNRDKFIFFSDVHRGDNSISDEFAHNQNIYTHALNHYFKEGFTYVELGDGDELWEHGDFRHIRRAHSDVYLLLRRFHDSGRFHMLYGNHNMIFKNQNHVKKYLHTYYDEYRDRQDVLFTGIKVHEAIIFKHIRSHKEFFVVHGHQGDFMNDQIWWLTRLVNRYFWHFLHVVGFRNPASPAKNMHKRHKIEKIFAKWIEETRKMMIVGHTHRPKFPNVDETPYFNTGSCIFPRSITGIEVAEGQISLVSWRVVPDEDGGLYIRRKIMKGPEPLERFMT